MLAPFAVRGQPDQSDIRPALERICASQSFAHAPKLTRFLRFVVDATLRGEGDRLKGYTIGVEALGRDESFNPQIDPIVRVEAIRLRAALDRYYAAAGTGDPVVIDMPRGHYVVRFRWRAPRAGPQAWRVARAIRSVQRFLNLRVTLQAPSDQF
jgi:hypothetical protein